MELKKYILGDVADFEISNVDKKIKDGEAKVRLCNFTDVYYNWAVTETMADTFMAASASGSQIKKLKLKKGQVAITKDSETRHDIGIPCYIADDLPNSVLGYHCALITPNPSMLDGCYLNAYLNSRLAKEYFANNASGSGMRYSLSVAAIKNILLYLPDIEIQRVIGNLFSCIDRKIALNREINRNLEAMARQLYDYWFVQFDFPDGNGRPYKSSGGKMVWNEKLKREIPEGWGHMKIGDYAHCKSGYAFKSNDFGINGIPVIKIGNINEDYTLSIKDCQRISNFCDNQYITKKFDVVIAMTGATIGKFAIVPGEYLVNQRVGKFDLRNNPLSRLGYLFNSLKLNYFREQIFQISGGCAQPNISGEQIESICVLQPIDSIIQKYNRICEPLLNKLIDNIIAVENLISQRDELLPLLMNGQVSVMPKEVNCDLSLD